MSSGEPRIIREITNSGKYFPFYRTSNIPNKGQKKPAQTQRANILSRLGLQQTQQT